MNIRAGIYRCIALTEFIRIYQIQSCQEQSVNKRFYNMSAKSIADFALQRYKLFFIYANERWLILTNCLILK